MTIQGIALFNKDEVTLQALGNNGASHLAHSQPGSTSVYFFRKARVHILGLCRMGIGKLFDIHHRGRARSSLASSLPCFDKVDCNDGVCTPNMQGTLRD